MPANERREKSTPVELNDENFIYKKISQIVFHLRQAHKSKHDVNYELIHE